VRTEIYFRQSITTMTLLAMLTFPVPGVATDNAGRYNIVSAPNDNTCGTFILARDEATQGHHLKENRYVLWFEGFVTAYNLKAPDTYDILGSTDLPLALKWLENYCRGNPQDLFALAAAKLMTELYPRRHKLPPNPGVARQSP
jgi:hypothetical protein